MSALTTLKALALAATPGKWEAKPHGRIIGGPMRHYVNGSAQAQIAACSVTFHDQAPDDEPERQQCNADFIAACSPETIISLIATIEALTAHPTQPTTSSVPMSVKQFDGYACAGVARSLVAPSAPDLTERAADLGVRDAALEEAAQYHEKKKRETSGSRYCWVHHESADAIRALRSQPVSEPKGTDNA